jgi:hypothetical protein
MHQNNNRCRCLLLELPCLQVSECQRCSAWFCSLVASRVPSHPDNAQKLLKAGRFS